MVAPAVKIRKVPITGTDGTRSRSASGQFAHPLPGGYVPGSQFEPVKETKAAYIGDEPASFVDRIKDAIEAQVGDEHAHPADTATEAPALTGDRYTLSIGGQSYIVSITKVFRVETSTVNRWRVRVQFEDAPTMSNGFPATIALTVAQFNALNPAQVNIVTVRNGRQGHIIRHLSDDRIVVQIHGIASVKLYWEIYTVEQLLAYGEGVSAVGTAFLPSASSQPTPQPVPVGTRFCASADLPVPSGAIVIDGFWSHYSPLK